MDANADVRDWLVKTFLPSGDPATEGVFQVARESGVPVRIPATVERFALHGAVSGLRRLKPRVAADSPHMQAEREAVEVYREHLVDFVVGLICGE